MQDFLNDLQALCNRHNVKLGPLYRITAGRWRSSLVAFRLGPDGKVADTLDFEPITPVRAEAETAKGKQAESKPVFGGYKHG